MKHYSLIQLGLTLACLCSSQALLANPASIVYSQAKPQIMALHGISTGQQIHKNIGTAISLNKHTFITNCHVLAGFDKFKLQNEQHVSIAKLTKGDLPRDLCMLYSHNAIGSDIQLRDSHTVRIGETVYAVGNPLGSHHAITQGIVSNIVKQHSLTWIQSDALTHFGSSGGGLFDQNGRLIGMTTAQKNRFSYAIPINAIQKLQSQNKTLSLQALNATFASNEAPLASLLLSYSKNLKLIKRIADIAVFQNQQRCFMLLLGRDKHGMVSGSALWSPKKSQLLSFFPRAQTARQVIQQTLSTLALQSQHIHNNVLLNSQLSFAGKSYRLKGMQMDGYLQPILTADIKANHADWQSQSHLSLLLRDNQQMLNSGRMTFSLKCFKKAKSLLRKYCSI